MVHAFSPIVLNYRPSGNDGNRYKPKVESLLPEVELGVAAPVPHHLKEDPGGCEKDHSNQQSIYSRRVNLAVMERLREGVVRCSMEAPIMHPVAHAGRPRDVLDVSVARLLSLLALAVGAAFILGVIYILCSGRGRVSLLQSIGPHQSTVCMTTPGIQDPACILGILGKGRGET